MPAVKRISASQVFTEDERARLVKVSSWRGLMLLAHAWGLILAAITAAVVFPHPLVWLIAIPVIGARQLGLATLMHDAAHGLLHPNRKLNDFLGQWLCALPIATDLNGYRGYHLQHHKFVQQPEDPDLVLSAPFPRSKASLARKFLRDMTGQTYAKQFFGTLLAALGRVPDAPADLVSYSRRTLLGFWGLTGLIIAGVYWISGSWAGLLWILSFATWFHLIIRIRNIGEHACTSTGDDPFSQARTTTANWLQREFIAPYWAHFHAEHHLFMYIPCYNLGEAHRLLMEKGYRNRMTIAPGYGAVLSRVTQMPEAAA